MVRKRILGVDFGHARIGLALSDESQIIASPLENLVVRNQNPADVFAAFLAKLIKEKGYSIEVIVVGLPLLMSGKDSQTTADARKFVDELRAKISTPIELFDERLTSVQADRLLIEADFTRKKRASFVDRVSATLLLQGFLDKRRAADFGGSGTPDVF